MIRLVQVCPNLPPAVEKMAAEILACCDPNLEARKQHRRDKLASFPQEQQAAVREAVNRVIRTRNDTNLMRGKTACSN